MSKIRSITITALFSALLAVSAWITVPLPFIPITMQVYVLALAVLVLGAERATVSVTIYLLLGVVGLPVFSSFRGGISVLFGATGGYIIGFLFVPLLFWPFEKKISSFGASLFALLLSLFACYLFGSVWFAVLYTRQTGAIGLGAVFLKCVLPFIVPDVIKTILAVKTAALLKKAGLTE